MSRRHNLAPAIALAVTGFLLVACSDGDSDGDSSTDAGPSQEPSSTPEAEETVLPDGVLPLPGPESSDEGTITTAGRYRVPLGATHAFDVDLPEGVSVNGDGLYLVLEEAILKVELAGEAYGIPSDPCSSLNEIEPAGPSVEDLVAAIRANPIYRASRPEPVEVGDAVGQFLELQVPRGYDASSCADGQVALPGNPGSNNNMSPGYVGDWWILDSAGQRVVAQTFCDDCDPAEIEPLTGIVRSITFTAAS